METDLLHTDGGDVHYQKWGRGNKLLVAVHGYGANAGMFQTLAEQLSDAFTIYAFDLPFHGKTNWYSEDYKRADIVEIIELILKRENANHFMLLGYSFGARVVMKLLDTLSTKAEHLFLLSPDGIRTRWLGAGLLLPKGMRHWLISMLASPDPFLKLIARLRRWGLIPFFVEWFLRKNLADAESRARLLCSWLSLNEFMIRLNKVKRIIQAHNIQVTIIVGERDKLLKNKAIQRFIYDLNGALLHTLPCNHVLDSNEASKIILEKAIVSPERL